MYRPWWQRERRPEPASTLGSFFGVLGDVASWAAVSPSQMAVTKLAPAEFSTWSGAVGWVCPLAPNKGF